MKCNAHVTKVTLALSRNVCNFVMIGKVAYILNQSTAKFGRISNSIEISLPVVGRAPYLLNVEKLKLGTNRRLT